MKYFAAAPKGFEFPLSQELTELGAEQIKESVAGVYFEADLATAYRIVMWSRLASRIMLILFEGKVDDAEALYEAAYAIDWLTHFDKRSTLAVDFSGTNTWLNNTQFGALKVKDAVVDRFRDDTDARPQVAKQDPDIRIHAFLKRDYVTISLNFSGPALHQRGYRQQTGIAPIKENLACALLRRAQWQVNQPTLLDPFCGSGTILVEAALWAADVAPALYRTQFGFTYWLGHNQAAWQAVHDDAIARSQAGLRDCTVRFHGSDHNSKMIRMARDHAQAAGVAHLIDFKVANALEVKAPVATGMVLSNPPFGERLGEFYTLLHLFYRFGLHLKQQFAEWQVCLLSSEARLLAALKLKYDKQVNLYNGSLACVFNTYTLRAAEEMVIKPLAESFVNRLKKNKKTIEKWAKKEGIDCYRLYDADIPEYNVAVDRYQDYVVIQEYAAPADIPQGTTEKRMTDLLLSLPEVLDIDPSNMVVKQRQRQRFDTQYERREEDDLLLNVKEYNALFKVNLTQYLDTGLFLDHRLTRRLVQEKAAGRDVLNLFAYTGTASVHAALGGATSVTTVDMSRTYIKWARENFALNQLSSWHYHFIQTDCLAWIKEEDRQYDLIFLDPPTFSNSKRMEQTFDVQRDYLDLLADVRHLLTPEGEIIFSNNKKQFKLDEAALAGLGLRAKSIDRQVLPLDFKRHPNIHHCWIITHAHD
jgi:23S rRNA (guanine2445-N2)-methyltransferase / 23S rRNA (guanine2069-N7)-methyltransferase